MQGSPLPPTSHRPSPTITAFLVGLALLLAVAWLVQLLFVVPVYEARFADLRLRVPFITEMMIGAARFVVRYWFVAIPGLLSVFVWRGGFVLDPPSSQDPVLQPRLVRDPDRVA